MRPDWKLIDETTPTDGRKVLACFKGQFGRWIIFTAIANKSSHGGVSAQGYGSPTHWAEELEPPVEELGS